MFLVIATTQQSHHVSVRSIHKNKIRAQFAMQKEAGMVYSSIVRADADGFLDKVAKNLLGTDDLNYDMLAHYGIDANSNQVMIDFMDDHIIWQVVEVSTPKVMQTGTAIFKTVALNVPAINALCGASATAG